MTFMPQETENTNTSYGLVQHIEAILFWRGDAMSVNSLAKITGAEKDAIQDALKQVKVDLGARGIVLIEHDGEYTLGTNPESAKLIEAARTEELSKDLGKAGLETLAIILYQGPIRRSEIDYIRGVNSNFILRNLLIRGLIERKPDPKNSRASIYLASIELLRFLGITHIEELKDFAQVQSAIEQFKTHEEEQAPETSTSPATTE
jgi:segregation and condensation protein B